MNMEQSLVLALTLALSFCSISQTAHAEELDHGGSFSRGQFWSVDGENPDPNNCFYLGTADNPRECSVEAIRQGYPYFKITHATYSYKDFSRWQFGNHDTLACFGCMK